MGAKKFLVSIILFSLLFLSASMVFPSELSLQDIPQIPGSVLEYSQFFGREHLAAQYRVMLPPDISFQGKLDRGRDEAQRCLDAMLKVGWTLKKENRNRRGGEFVFSKDIIKEAKVIVAPGSQYLQGKKRDCIYHKFELKRLIPYEDVPGYDYPDVPRFPGSIRIRWMDLLGDYGAKYLWKGSLEEVKKFYEKELPDLGWQPGRGPGKLNYLKGGYTSGETKSIPTTLSIHLDEKEGIVAIGIGRTAGAGDRKIETMPAVTPAKKTQDPPVQVLTFINHEKDLPMYPALKKKHVEPLPVNLQGEEIIRLTLETGAVKRQTAIHMAEFYLREMRQRGWDLKNHEWHGLARRMLFQRGAVQVKVNIKAVGRYPIPGTEMKQKINIPVQVDVVLPIPRREKAGKDIPNVPRFPGSVRFHYLEAGLDHSVKYKAAARLKDVEWFFIEELPGSGWRFAGYDTTGLLFVPAAAPKSAAAALAGGKLIPTTLKLKVDDMWNGTVKFGLNKTRGD